MYGDEERRRRAAESRRDFWDIVSWLIVAATIAAAFVYLII